MTPDISTSHHLSFCLLSLLDSVGCPLILSSSSLSFVFPSTCHWVSLLHVLCRVFTVHEEWCKNILSVFINRTKLLQNVCLLNDFYSNVNGKAQFLRLLSAGSLVFPRSFAIHLSKQSDVDVTRQSHITLNVYCNGFNCLPLWRCKPAKWTQQQSYYSVRMEGSFHSCCLNHFKSSCQLDAQICNMDNVAYICIVNLWTHPGSQRCLIGK